MNQFHPPPTKKLGPPWVKTWKYYNNPSFLTRGPWATSLIWETVSIKQICIKLWLWELKKTFSHFWDLWSVCPLFVKMRIPFSQGCFVQSKVVIGRVVQSITLFQYYILFEKCWAFYLKKLYPNHQGYSMSSLVELLAKWFLRKRWKC